MIALDASVVVKFFKEGEEWEAEANRLYRMIEGFTTSFFANEWLLLEVVRALVKTKFSRGKIEDAFEVLNELFFLHAIHKVSVSSVIPLAKKLEYELALCAADSVHLATAIIYSADFLLTADGHLLNKKVKDYAHKHGLKVVTLPEFFQWYKGGV